MAIGFFRDITGRSVGFFELSYYMLPLGAVMVLLLWGFFMLYFPPEKKTIPGLRQRAQRLYAGLGPISGREILAVVIVLSAIVLLGLRSFVPALEPLGKETVVLVATILFFLFRTSNLRICRKTWWPMSSPASKAWAKKPSSSAPSKPGNPPKPHPWCLCDVWGRGLRACGPYPLPQSLMKPLKKWL